MKLFYFTLLLTFALTFAQNGEQEQTRCYNGTSGENATPINEVVCNFPSSSCMTKFESKDNYFKVTRECTQTQACQNNAGGNVPKCYPGENGVRQCFFCCASDLCNDNTSMIPDQPEASGENAS